MDLRIVCSRPWRFFPSALAGGLLLSVQGLAVGAPGAPTEPSRRGGNRYNVVQIVLDTTRADHMSLYGYERETTPHLDALAEGSVTWTHCRTNATFTYPSVATIVTSLLPQSHRTYAPTLGLHESYTTIFEVMKEYDYRTAFISGNSGLWSPDRNVDQGADYSVYRGRPDSRATRAFFEFVDDPAPGPFFAHIQYFGSHAAYTPSAAFDSMFVNDEFYGDLGDTPKILPRGCVGGLDRGTMVDSILALDYYVAQYDALVAESDHEISKVLNGLQKRGLLDSTLVIVTADHGELLVNDHGRYFCHTTFFEGNNRVPLIMKMPRDMTDPPAFFAGKTFDTHCSLLDLMPTILGALGMDIPAQCQGVNLLETLDPGLVVGGEIGSQMIQHGRYKLVLGGGGDSLSLYDFEADPREEHNIAWQDSSLTQNLLDALIIRSERAEKVWPETPKGPFFKETFENSAEAARHFFLGDRDPEWFGWDSIEEPGSKNMVLRGYSMETGADWLTGSCAIVEAARKSYSNRMHVQLRRGTAVIQFCYTSFRGIGYELVLRPDQIELATVFRDHRTVLGTAEVPLGLGAWNHISFGARKGSLSVALNGTTVMQAYERRWDDIHGTTEFKLEANSEVWIDNIALFK